MTTDVLAIVPIWFSGFCEVFFTQTNEPQRKILLGLIQLYRK